MTSTLTRFINPFIQYSDGNGVPLKGGKLYSYVSGTDTLLNTYSDSALTVPNTNPITLNGSGYVPGAIFLGVGTYKFRLFDADGNEYPTADPVAGAQATGGTLPVLSGNVGDFGKTIEVSADGQNYQLTTILNSQYTIASALASGGATLTIKDEGATSVANAHPFIQFGESSVVGGTQANMGIIGFSDGVTSPVTFTGSGLNDATSGGTETSGRPHTYTVIIDGTGTPDTFKWQIDSGAFTSGVAITGAIQTLANGVTIKFNATTGHTLTAQWVFQTGEALNIRNSISGGNINLTTTGTGGVYINGTPLTIPTIFNYCTGLLPFSISGTNTTAAVTISAGQATDSTNSTSLTKTTNTSWLVSNGNAINGYQGGTTLPNSATIHFFICQGVTGNGIFASTSLTPTLPSGYNSFFRRVFSLNTNSSGALIPGVALETEGGSLLFWLSTQIEDINTTTLSTTQVLSTLTVPTGIKVMPIYRTNTPTSGNAVILTSGDETDVAPSAYNVNGFTTAPGYDLSGMGSGGTTNAVNQVGSGIVTTNTSGQIGVRASAAATTLYLVTRGFKDFRRG